MSTQYFCDRCGSKTGGCHPIATHTWESGGCDWYTLCKTCHKELKAWFKGEAAPAVGKDL